MLNDENFINKIIVPIKVHYEQLKRCYINAVFKKM